MKVIGFVGSARKEGNTSILVKKVLEGAGMSGAETKLFFLNDYNIKGCQSCFGCKMSDGGCRQKDDMIPLYDEIASADAVVVGSPLYMRFITGPTKTFLDRWFAFMVPNSPSKLAGKKMALVIVHGQPGMDLFRQNWTILEGAVKVLGVDLMKSLVAPGFRDAGAVAGDNAIMQKALALGQELAK